MPCTLLASCLIQIERLHGRSIPEAQTGQGAVGRSGLGLDEAGRRVVSSESGGQLVRGRIECNCRGGMPGGEGSRPKPVKRVTMMAELSSEKYLARVYGEEGGDRGGCRPQIDQGGVEPWHGLSKSRRHQPVQVLTP